MLRKPTYSLQSPLCEAEQCSHKARDVSAYHMEVGGAQLTQTGQRDIPYTRHCAKQ